ncbi:MAG: hypothetical protein K6A65_00795, partial [Succinivibrionaceae bacterium]|nr:hypothetical protein [Succinivibrionaceae bacterium]
PAPTAEGQHAPTGFASAQQQASAQQGEEEGATTGSGSIGQAISDLSAFVQGGLGIKPPPAFDIKTLDEHEITVTDDGEIEMALDPEAAKQLREVAFELYYMDEGEDVMLALGTDIDFNVDEQGCTYRDNFQGTWAAIGDHYLYLDVAHSDEDTTRYHVPVKIDGKRHYLDIIYDYGQQKYLLLGAREHLEGGAADKILRHLRPGDELTTLMPAATITGDDELREIEFETFRLGEGFAVEDYDTGDGTFLFRYRMTDLKGNKAYSKFGSFEIKDGNITTDLASLTPRARRALIAALARSRALRPHA